MADDNGSTVEATESSTAVVEYSETEAMLSELEASLQNKKYDVTNKDGMEEARKDRRQCVKLRTDLEKDRKFKKAPILEAVGRLDGQAKAITARVKALETPIDTLITAQEEKVKAEKLAKAIAEKERVDGIMAKIFNIKELPQRAMVSDTPTVEAFLDDLRDRITYEGEFAEFNADFDVARDQTINSLEQLLENRKTHEAEQAKLKADQEELEEKTRVQNEINKLQKAAITYADWDQDEIAAAIEQIEAFEPDVSEIEGARLTCIGELNQLRKKKIADAKLQAERDEVDRQQREAQERIDAKEKEIQDEKDRIEADERAKVEAEAEKKRIADNEKSDAKLKKEIEKRKAEEKKRKLAEAKCGSHEEALKKILAISTEDLPLEQPGHMAKLQENMAEISTVAEANL